MSTDNKYWIGKSTDVISQSVSNYSTGTTPFPQELITVTPNNSSSVTSEVANPGTTSETIKFTVKGVVNINTPTVIATIRIECTDRTVTVENNLETLHDYESRVAGLADKGEDISSQKIHRVFSAEPFIQSIGEQISGTNVKLRLKETIKNEKGYSYNNMVVGYVYELVYTADKHTTTSSGLLYNFKRNVRYLSNKELRLGHPNKIVKQCIVGKNGLSLTGEVREISVVGDPGAKFWLTVVKEEENGGGFGRYVGLLTRHHEALYYDEWDINGTSSTDSLFSVQENAEVALRFKGAERQPWEIKKRVEETKIKNTSIIKVNRMHCVVPSSGVYRFSQRFPNTKVINPSSPKGLKSRALYNTKYIVVVGGEDLVNQLKHSALSKIVAGFSAGSGVGWGYSRDYENFKYVDLSSNRSITIPSPNTFAGWDYNKYPFAEPVRETPSGDVDTDTIVTHDLVQRKNIKVSFRLLSTLSATKPLNCNSYSGTPAGSWSPYTGQPAGGNQTDEVANFVNLYPDSVSANTIIPGVTQNEWSQTMQTQFTLTYHVAVTPGLGNNFVLTPISPSSVNLIFDALNESGQCSWTNTNPTENGGTKFTIDDISVERHLNTHEATIKFQVTFLNFGEEDVNVDLDLDSIFTW